MNDRNRGYIPQWGPGRDGPNVFAEVEVREPRAGIQTPTAPLAHGLADELNRSSTWMWAEVSGSKVIGEDDEDGGIEVDGVQHWTHFRGHIVQVDVQLSTWNEREVNDWKGRDEIRPSGGWAIMFNRIQVFSGSCGSDPLETLLSIRDTIQRLQGLPPFNRWTQEEIDGLEGRPIYLKDTPAVITRQMIASEGRIVVDPVEGHTFRAPAWTHEDEGEAEAWEDDYGKSCVTTLFDPDIWWWRKTP